MVEVFTNPNDQNDTNEANLARVMQDALMEVKVEQTLSEWIEASGGSAVSVVQMDMDKSVEIRKCGISYKLQVLREVEALLKQFSDENCLVISHGTRDDITLLRKNLKSIAEEEAFVRHVLQTIEQTPLGHGMDKGPFYITYSAGIAIFPAHGKTAAQLLHLADGAIRWVKDHRRGSCAVAEPCYGYPQRGMLDGLRWKKLFALSCRTGKTMDELIREGYEVLFQKHSALYRFCCQENEGMGGLR